MGKYSSKELDAVYHALANTTRRKILTLLCKSICTVTELSEPFDMSLAAISKHIKVLEKAGLLEKHHEGPTHHCRVNLEPIRSAGALVHYFEQFLTNNPETSNAVSYEDQDSVQAA